MAITTSNNMRLRAPAIYNELVRQINERIAAVNAAHGSSEPALPTWAAGDILTGTDTILAMQDKVLFLANNMLRNAWVTSLEPDFPAPSPDRLFTDTFGSLKSGYFRRATATTSPARGFTLTNYLATGFLYGSFVHLDKAGPWMFYDLQTVISQLDTVIITVAPTVTHTISAARSHSDTAWNYSYTSTTLPYGTATVVGPTDVEVSTINPTSATLTVNGLHATLTRSIRIVAKGSEIYSGTYYDFAGSFPTAGALVSTYLGASASVTIPSYFQPKSFATLAALYSASASKTQKIATQIYCRYTFT